MNLDDLVSAILPAVQEFTSQAGQMELSNPLELRRSARLPLLAALYRQSPQPLLLICDRHDRALTAADELRFWLPGVPLVYFPEPNPLFYENAPWGMNTRRDRLGVLAALATYHIPGAARPEQPPLVVAPVRAVMARTLPRRDFLKAVRSYTTGQIGRPDDFFRQWLALGYEAAHTVTAPGQAARRGGILDIWIPAESLPVRLEFFGDEIDSLRRFDPGTQRTIQHLERLQVTPAREYLATPETSEKARPLAVEGPDGEPVFHEFLIPIFHPQPASVLDYLPRQSLVLLEDASLLRDTVNEIEEQSLGLKRDYSGDGLLPQDFPPPYLSWSEIEDSLGGRSAVNLGGGMGDESDQITLPGEPAPAAPPAQPGRPALKALFSPGPRFGGRLKPLMEHLRAIAEARGSAFIVSRQVPRLQELWSEESRLINLSWAPVFIEGSLTEGWVLRSGESLWHLLTDGEIFGWRRPEPRQRHRPQAEAPEAAYADLRPGDWVVHIDHGVGRLVDLVRRTMDGVEREYLCVEYAGGDQLFVPVYQADRLTRYVGPEGKEPTPTRLGSAEWRSAKSDVKEAVQEVAEDLLELYARRMVVLGHSFSPDPPWQQELEASFPYVETEDQLRVIGEVKRDMESARPMDRLICGDVGYGKTEVALRAAFKAVLDGCQVAILVPTTVLAQQHYNTFRERLAAFPAEVEMLSRFRTPQQQKEILGRLAEGKVDIIIGTHRLIQGDVTFKNLGLLIIDEEQRFGVGHKEVLKKMRTEVDVLTMTATPIPRTMYMALTGVRDISTINTPPEERLPIVTHVGPYSPRLVRQAILRELERGGQVFFVHNRVQTIGGIRAHLVKLVPEARLAVAHGQMPEHELSERMEQFASGDVDVLLSTSIIESGLDIPNANTLIVDRADTFGLAQLYQLRGRVGRGAQRAYAYFFRHSKRLPTAEGLERLETISENTQLGAGFSIAMRDLEIRGMGDILGHKQHGHIAAVGFHLYTRLLADAVRRIRVDRGAMKPEEKPASAPAGSQAGRLLEMSAELRLPVNVDLPLRASVPINYVPDRDTRLRLYRRIADATSLHDMEALQAEFADRFGPLPDELLNLLYQIKVRLLAEKAGLASVSAENNQIVLRYPPLAEDAAPRRYPPDLSLSVRTGKNSLWLPLSEGWAERLIELLETLGSWKM